MPSTQTNMERWAEGEILGGCVDSEPLPIPHVVEETDELCVVLTPSHRERFDILGRLKWHKIIIYKGLDTWSCDCDGQRYRRKLDKDGRPRCVDVDILRWYGKLKKKRRGGVQRESMEAYGRLCREDLGAMQMAVYDALGECGPCTDRELLEHMRRNSGMGWEPNNVWPRRNELMNDGFVLQVGVKPQASKRGDGTERVNHVAVWRLAK